MKFKIHPIVTDLKVNEDGSQLFYKGEPIYAKGYKQKNRHYSQKLVNFNGKTHTLSKLICETWNGLRPNQDMVVKKRDFNPENYHYTNLYWAPRGGMRTKKTKRVKTSKISEKEIAVIIERLEAGDSLRTIAKAYNTSDMSIHRIKRNYLEDKKLILKREIMKARDPYYKRLAFAKYFGFENIGNAVDALGRNNFILKCQQIAL